MTTRAATTRARVLTPAGRGAIAVVEVVGPGADAAIDRWFVAANGRPLAEQPIDAIRFGTWRRRDGDRPDPDAPGEELVVVRTAGHRVEVHCHGGAAAPAAVVASLAVEGVQAAEPSDGTLADEARRALSFAPTERVAGVLLDQVNGALETAIHAILADLNNEDRPGADAKLHALLSRERLGRRLTTPWRVVLAGPPNVGKSSLINALVGYDRAIVYDQPGTTRDVVTATTALGGWPVTLADTAGLRATDDPLEAAGVGLARRTLATADVLVLVREATLFDTDQASVTRGSLLAGVPAGVPVVEVANKADLLPPGVQPIEGVLATIAPSGVGVRELLLAIEQAFAIDPPEPDTAVPFEPWHFETLRRAASADAVERRALLLALLAGRKP